MKGGSHGRDGRHLPGRRNLRRVAQRRKHRVVHGERAGHAGAHRNGPDERCEQLRRSSPRNVGPQRVRRNRVRRPADRLRWLTEHQWQVGAQRAAERSARAAGRDARVRRGLRQHAAVAGRAGALGPAEGRVRPAHPATVRHTDQVRQWTIVLGRGVPALRGCPIDRIVSIGLMGWIGWIGCRAWTRAAGRPGRRGQMA